jgi:ubiquinone/menaquinone biosynthesis C-methylase UbiE
VPLSAEQARRVYDRIGLLQDSQAFYEDAAVERMIALGDLAAATSVFELGCGTGRLGRRLLAGHSPVATYLATDVSPRMARIAERRLRPWADRAKVIALEPGVERLPGDDGGFDRFLATYVFDLLEERDAQGLLAEAHRLLGGDGRLCAVSITGGRSGASRVLMSALAAVAESFPPLVGGCRPIDLTRLLDRERWVVTASEVVISWAVSSQIVVARAADGS